MNQLGDAPPEDFEERFEEIDEKVFLAGILTELQAIRSLLSQDAKTDAPSTVRCLKCNDVVDVEDAEKHLQSEHKAPAGIDPTPLFEAVE